MGFLLCLFYGLRLGYGERVTVCSYSFLLVCLFGVGMQTKVRFADGGLYFLLPKTGSETSIKCEEESLCTTSLYKPSCLNRRGFPCVQVIQACDFRQEDITMNLLIKAKDIRVEYAGREVLDIDELELHDDERIGLVGGNGAGKSTLMKVLLGELAPSGCKIQRLGHFTHIAQLEEAVLQEEQDPVLLGKLGVSRLEMQTMSGGEETRLKIVQALSEQVHGIFADEPTCHLDGEGIDFLIGQLKYFSGALLIISHNRYFLDRVVDKIWELKAGKITEYWGNYSDYLRQKEEERQSQTARYEQFVLERDRLQRAVDEKMKKARKIDQKPQGITAREASGNVGRLSHFKSYGSKQKAIHTAAKAIESRMENMEEVRAPEVIRTICFRQSKALALHNPYPITGTDISKSFSDKVIFDKASFQVPLGAKVALTGGNGAGKTTLFHMILNRESGITVSPKAEIGYFAQNGYKYNRNQGVMKFMQEDCDYPVSEIRSVLASMGFSQNDIQKDLSVLSGGEIIKLLLTRMLLGRYNILLMDEPSNFLDLPGVEALEHLMKNYTGTILFISHDKRLLENVADRVYAIKDRRFYLEK